MLRIGSGGFLLAVAALPMTGAESGRVAGAVTSLVHGTGLAGAVVRLQEEDGHLRPPDPFDSAYSVVTDEKGRFVFEGVSPGTYRLYADAHGHVRAFHGARGGTTPVRGIPIRVLSGRTIQQADIVLPPEGAIRGRVRMNGEAVSRVQVSALRRSYSRGRPLLIPMAFTATDERGEYVLPGLHPASYLVRVDHFPPPRIAGGGGQASRQPPTEALQPVYYPDSPAEDGALPVSVAAGGQVDGIDFYLKPRPLYRVVGKVDWKGVGPPEGGLVLQLSSAALDVRAAVHPNLARVSSDGSFVFDQVWAGDYFVEPARIRVDTAKQRRITGRSSITVRDEIDGEAREPVALQLWEARTVVGRVRRNMPGADGGVDPGRPSLKGGAVQYRGAAPPPPPGHEAGVAAQAEAAPEIPSATASETAGSQEAGIEGVLIQLVAADRLAVNAPRATSASGGRFSIEAVPLGQYQVSVAKWPEGMFVKAVLFNGADAMDSTVEMLPGLAAELEVVLADGAGEIGGVVRDAEGAPAPGVLVSIWRDSVRGAGMADLAVAVTADHQGNFRAGQLGPGEYRLAAWEDLDPGLAEAATFCRQFASSASKVTIKQGQSKARADLKAVGAAATAEMKLRSGM